MAMGCCAVNVNPTSDTVLDASVEDLEESFDAVEADEEARGRGNVDVLLTLSPGTINAGACASSSLAEDICKGLG